MPFTPPPPDCPLCPRLAGFLATNRVAYPEFWNAPVPSFGGLDARLLIVGLAPGLKGANRTGRPFTGDYAGDVLYEALDKYGFSKGTFKQRPDDGLELVDCRISNAVRCVPPENKPLPVEISTCNQFLKQEIAAMPRLKIIFSLGSISHNAALKALGFKASHAKFIHGAHHPLTVDGRGLTLVDTYHSSRYNINTGRLTREMFDEVLESIRNIL